MSDNHKNTLKTAFNDVTGDTIRTGKGSQNKYAQGWDAIFSKKAEPGMILDSTGLLITERDGKTTKWGADGSLTFTGLSAAEAEAIRVGWENTWKRIAARDEVAWVKFVERNVQDDAVFADMHARKEQFSAETVWEAFKDVPRRETSAVMALDFHDSEHDEHDSRENEEWEAWRDA